MAGSGSIGVEVACAQASILGEGPVWDHRINRLHWVDIRARAILTLDPATGITRRVPTRDDVGFVVLSREPNVVIAGLRAGIARIDLDTGAASLLVAVDADQPSNRLNDGTVAPDGAILFGTLDMDHANPSGSYYRYHRGELTRLGGSMIVTNGPGLSADGKTAITVDTIERKLHRQAYVDGRFVAQGQFATIPAGQGMPDGVTFDAEGCVWVAHYGGGRLSRLQADGSIERVVNIPALQVTKCAFGGADLRTLYITTAAYRRPLADEPLAGCLFQLHVDAPGNLACIADV